MAGFISKYLFISNTINSLNSEGLIFFAIVTICALVISTLLNTIYYLRTVITIYSQPEEGKDHLKRSKYDIGFVLSTVVFIALIFTLGLFPSQIIEIIKTGISLLG